MPANQNNVTEPPELKRATRAYWRVRNAALRAKRADRQAEAQRRIDEARMAVESLGGTLPPEEVEWDEGPTPTAVLTLGGAVAAVIPVAPEPEDGPVRRSKLIPGFTVVVARRMMRRWGYHQPEDAPAIMADYRYWQMRACGWDPLMRGDDGRPIEPVNTDLWDWWTGRKPNRRGQFMHARDRRMLVCMSRIGVRSLRNDPIRRFPPSSGASARA